MSDDLNNLPIVRVKETFWYRNYLDDSGKVIERHHVVKLFIDRMRLEAKTFVMRVKCRLAFWLLSGVGDPCPYCRKIIDIGNWKKMFDSEGE